MSSVFAQTTGSRSSSFSYDGTSGQLTQEVIEPGTSALRLETDHTYDTFGNRISASTSGGDVATRIVSANYDVRGQFATSVTNALSQSTTFQYDSGYGGVTSTTDANGVSRAWTYDGFGRPLAEVYGDGTRRTWSYAYCSGVGGGTATCPSLAAYVITEQQFAADGMTRVSPTKTTYYDQLNRVIASDTQGFDGALIRTAITYDALGHVAQQSRPYLVSGGAVHWASFTRDVLGRTTLATLPDTTTVSFAYHGLTVSKSDVLGRTRTVVRNSQNQIVSVRDPLNQQTSYFYSPFGGLAQVIDAAGNISVYGYDTRGRLASSTDPDLGRWTYAYDSLDELVSQTDAKGQVTSFAYDLLGRLTGRSEPDLASSFVYDTASHGIGRLASASTSTGYHRIHSYDASGRPSGVQLTIGSDAYNYTTSYDAAGRISSVSYPSGLSVAYSYNIYGYQSSLTNAGTGQALWTANARNADLNLTQETTGNGVVTDQTFDAATGRLSGISAGSSGSVENISYGFDSIGRLASQQDLNSGLDETFSYDALSRLTSSTVAATPTPLVKTFSYSAVGNLLSKSDVGTYSYPASGLPLPHAVTSVAGDTLNATFTYDANGNQTSGAGLTISYASFNKPVSITRGTTTIGLDHDPEHQRFRQTSGNGTTLYLNDAFGSGIGAERFSASGGSVQWTSYLVAGGQIIGAEIESNAQHATLYFHKDRLGSVATITDGSGAVVERLSYDSWGKRRYPNGMDDLTGSIVSQTTRGYTGHEMLQQVGLVHMNGRVYDPNVAHFTSADIIVSHPFGSQSWNGYSYVANNPLNRVDPSGWQDVVYQMPDVVITTSPIGGTSGPGTSGWGGVPGIAMCSGGCGYSSSGSGYSYGNNDASNPFDDFLSPIGVLELMDYQRQMATQLGSAWPGIAVVLPQLPVILPHQTLLSPPPMLTPLADPAGFVAGNAWDNLGTTSDITARVTGASAYQYASGAITDYLSNSIDALSQIPGDVDKFISHFTEDPLEATDEIAESFPPTKVVSAGGFIFGIAARNILGEFKLTDTVARHSIDLVGKGPFKGELARPFMNSPLTVQEIMATGKGVADPGGVPGALSWAVSGTFRGVEGTWELVIKDNLILHYNFVGK